MTKTFVLSAVVLALFAVPAAASQSLADAAKKAQEDRAKGMGWPAPVAPKEIAPGAVTPDPAPTTDTAPATESTTDKPVKKDETYWKGRMRTLTTKLADDQGLLAAAETSERALNDRVNKPLDHIDAIRDRRQWAVLEDQWQEAIKDVNRLKGAVKNDERAKADLELEAHRAGVPPGWLVLE